MIVPKDIRHHLARAKGYLQKKDLPMALESLSMALRQMSSQHLHCVPTVEREVNALIASLAQEPALAFLLDPHGNGNPRPIIYTYGREGALATVLREFAKILREHNHDLQEKYQVRERLQELLRKGLNLMEEGQLGTGAAFLQRAASEYPQDVSHITSIGQALMHYKQYSIAAKMFLDSLPHHPKQKDFYSKAIEAYMHIENYAGAEYVFHRAMQQFGRHPRSIAKLAQLYLLWGKNKDAEALAIEALEMDSTESLAHEVLMAVPATEDSYDEELEEYEDHTEPLFEDHTQDAPDTLSQAPLASLGHEGEGASLKEAHNTLSASKSYEELLKAYAPTAEAKPTQPQKLTSPAELLGVENLEDLPPLVDFEDVRKK